MLPTTSPMTITPTQADVHQHEIPTLDAPVVFEASGLAERRLRRPVAGAQFESLRVTHQRFERPSEARVVLDGDDANRRRSAHL